MANNVDEENFQEALRDAHRYFDVPRLRDELSEVMNELREKTLTATDSIYAFMIVSLAEYLDSHDQLPPLESVPDMHSTSEYFLALQEVFRKKAQQVRTNVAILSYITSYSFGSFVMMENRF